MPHDYKGQKLEVGDLVTMMFEVTNISQNEADCNLNLQAIDLSASGQTYLPTIACNSKLTKHEEVLE